MEDGAVNCYHFYWFRMLNKMNIKIWSFLKRHIWTFKKWMLPVQVKMRM